MTGPDIGHRVRWPVDLGATGVPETYMVAPNGIIVERILGGITHELLDSIIDHYSNPQ